MRLLPLIVVLFFQIAAAQKVTLVSKTSMDADQFIGIDTYGNSYFVKNTVLHKQGPEGEFANTNFQLGRIASVDIVNPLKVVVFYADVNTVVFLDNKLSEIDRINFNNLPEFVNVAFTANAGNNRLWIFNVDNQQLELFNYQTNTTTTVSQPFSGKILGLASNFNYCHLLSENKLRSFNVYGSILAERPADDFEKIAMSNDTVVGLKENELFFLKEDTLIPLKVPLPENQIKDLHLSQEFLYIYDGKSVHTFSLTIPKK